jgi:hypothetical protein
MPLCWWLAIVIKAVTKAGIHLQVLLLMTGLQLVGH